jgi:hypothetical protein
MKVQEALRSEPSNKYCIEKHGNGYAIYLGRGNHHHGMNLGHITEVSEETIAILNKALSALSELEKCEPVAEALHERNRLGYAVVDVIGTLDEIIENAQEVEVDDFLHIAIPIDKWHELQDALEEMPKRAELYTSPISKESTDWQYFDEAYKKATESSEPDDWMNAALMAQQVRRRMLDTSPQPRELVGLSVKHREELIAEFYGNDKGFQWLIRATESKLKQLNTKG